MLRFLQISLVMTLGFTLAGCNRAPVQPALAPSVPTSTTVDRIPPVQDPAIRVDADRRDVDVIIDRPGILGDRKIEVHRDADGNATRDVTRDPTERPLLDRKIDVQVTPGQGVKVDLGK